MEPIVPIVALGVVAAASSAVARPLNPGSNVSLSPPAAISPLPVPTVNTGALGVVAQQGISNPGLISPSTPSQIGTPDLSGALPGEPGLPT
jgi:hypothetical protein